MRSRIAVLLFSIWLMCAIAPAQTSTGIPKFSSVTGGPDVINLGNLNVHFAIPVVSKPGRGIPFTYTLSYDSSVWYPSSPGSGSWVPVTNFGWRGHTEMATGYLSYRSSARRCPGTTISEGSFIFTFGSFVYHDSWGVPHSFPGTAQDAGDCPDPSYTALNTGAHDGSGYHINFDPSGNTADALTSKSGELIDPAINDPNGGSTATDSNGNQMVVNGNGTFTDTLGTTVLSITGTDPSPVVFKYKDTTGADQPVTVTYATKTLKTNFGCAGITEYGPTSANLISDIGLPDGSSYHFEYEDTPGFSGDVTGRIKSISLRTGGIIQYQYTGNNNGIICADGSTAGLSRITPDSETPWSYSREASGTAWITTVQSPLSDKTVISFQQNGAYYYEALRQIYQGQTTLLRTINTCYNGATGNCSNTAITLPISEISTITKLDNNLESETDTFYNGSYTGSGLVSEVDEYDFGSPGPGALLRKTITSYASLGNGIIAAPSSVQVKDGNGNQVAYSSYGYDETPLTTTSGVPQHVGISGSRGNVTTISRWLNTTNSSLSTTIAYDDTGNVVSITDPQSHQTTYSYDTSTRAYVTEIANALHQHQQFDYYFAPGLLKSAKDQNDIDTSRVGTTYTYDAMGRVVSISLPDGGGSTNEYTVSSSSSIQTAQAAAPNVDIVTTTFLDGLGRTIRRTLSDPEVNDSVDTSYDAVGRVHATSNPYRSSPSPTDGTTTIAYDALGRITNVTEQEGNIVHTDYAGNCATVTDEAGRKRKSCSDALGRLTGVWEDPNGANYETDYQYDVLGNLTRVDQKGDSPGNSANWRTRTFTYDSLSRMLSENNPETGLICYGTKSGSSCNNDGYDSDGNLIARTDARNVTVSYGYDGLHRLTSINHPAGTPNVVYGYDESNVWGQTLSNTVGRISSKHANDGSTEISGTLYSYDPVGQSTSQITCTPQTCFTVTAGYDLAGHLSSLTYPSGRKITAHYASSGKQLNVIFDSFNGQSVGYTYWSWSPYSADPRVHPNGAQKDEWFGNGNIFQYTWLNSRLQPTETQTQSTQVWAHHSYSFNTGSGNNGNLLNVTDVLSSGKTQSFDYDALNRLHGSSQSDASWSQTHTPDAWGDLQQSGTINFMPTFDGNNRVSPNTVGTCNNSPGTYCYDAAGNMTWDTQHAYAFDAEGRVKSVDTSGATYTYDADSNRIRKDVGSDATEYIYFGGQVLGEYKPATGDWSDYIYADGRRIARADSFADFIHISGATADIPGWQYAGYDFPAGTASFGHTITSGDKLFLKQYQSTNACGGIVLGFSDGTTTTQIMADTGGTLADEDNVHGTWHVRTFDLSAYATTPPKTINRLYLVLDHCTPRNAAWDIYYRDISVVAADGTVFPVYNGQSSVSLSTWSSAGMINPAYSVYHMTGEGVWPTESTTYYHGDHLGSSRLMTNAAGYPIWSGTFLPFGYEFNPQTTTNKYKFTGMESDSETGLNHTWFRQQSPVMGRWLTPDPAGMAAADLSNPQSLNRYAYVGNSPTDNVDPLGLKQPRCEPHESCGGDPSKTGYWNYTYVKTRDWIPGPWEFATDGDAVIPLGQGSGYWGPEYYVFVAAYMSDFYFGAGSLGGSVAAAANNDVPLNPYAQAVFSQPVLQTTAATMTNPCTYAGWTAAAGLAGAGGAAVANYSEIEAAAVNNAPTIYTRILNWWFNLTSRPGKPGLIRAAAATAVATKDAVVSTCKSF